MTNLQAIAARVLKEDGVVSLFVMHWTLYVERTDLCCDLREPVYLGGTLSPESNAVFIWSMDGGLRNPEEFCDTVARSLKLKPALDSYFT